ncbi:MAG: GNAT family N-acetyltransferase [Planctomycetota bacterium]|nr:MAG: GNAT family N-acetyltransferase [Planctomycetota bacterium]
MTTTIKLITFNSNDYHKAFKFRNDLLRKPLGLDLSDDDLSNEINNYHFGTFENEEIIACLVGTEKDKTTMKIRQMAVSEKYQSRGLGKQMMIYAETFFINKGFKQFELNAREHAIPFYEKLGYHSVGDIFMEVTIKHVKMFKVYDN